MRGGQVLEIQGLKIKLPDRPPDHEILNFGVWKRDQKWHRTELPEFDVKDVDIWDGTEFRPGETIPWEEAERQEHIKIYGTDPMELDRSGVERKVAGVDPDPDYCMECLNAFRQQELNRIFNGVWMFINGEAYYIPGCYYFYLNYWQLKDGYAEFRYTDLELCLFWEHVKNSENFLGMIYVTMRGAGKSYIAGCFSFLAAASKKKAVTTVQSKSNDDAQKFFREKVLVPITQLPKFLIPINKHVGDLSTLNSLDFSPPSRKAMSARLYNKLKKDALYSKMEFHNSGEFAADGGTYDLIVSEECGKTDPSVADVYKRTMINYFTVFRGNKKLGNQFLSSTVEDMEDGGAECKKIWDYSNQYKLNGSGMTNTGLARFFRSCLDTTFFDEYGFPDRERARFFHEEKRKALEHDPASWVSYVQKNPMTEAEAFWIKSEKCIYNADVLLKAKRTIEESEMAFVRRGDFRWNVRDQKAEFIDNDANGRWAVSNLVVQEANGTKVNPGSIKTFTPLYSHKRVIGFDPFATADLARDDQGSDGAAVVYQKYDINLPEDSCETVIATYLFRPATPQECFEDILIAAFYFGCEILVETNKGDFHYYAKLRGYKWGNEGNPSDMIMQRPASTIKNPNASPTDGLYQSAATIDQYTNATAFHVNHHGWKLKHVDLIDQLLLFSPQKTKKFDLAVAFGLALLGAERKVDRPIQDIDLGNLFKTFNNSGTMSVLN